MAGNDSVSCGLMRWGWKVLTRTVKKICFGLCGEKATDDVWVSADIGPVFPAEEVVIPSLISQGKGPTEIADVPLMRSMDATKKAYRFFDEDMRNMIPFPDRVSSVSNGNSIPKFYSSNFKCSMRIDDNLYTFKEGNWKRSVVPSPMRSCTPVKNVPRENTTQFQPVKV